eukprot:gene4542-5139_t
MSNATNSIGSRPASRLDDPPSLFSSLEDIRGFRGIRATTIQDNHAFWKRVLTAYETEVRRDFAGREGRQHNIRVNRIKSAPVKSTNRGGGKKIEKEEDHGKLLPRRCNSELAWSSMDKMSENRAVMLRSQHISHLHSLNAFSAMTKMQDYQHNMRHNRPSHSARYPRFITKEKQTIDPEWAVVDEYDVYIFHSKRDTRWVKNWLKGLLEAKRYNVKMKANYDDLQRYFTAGIQRSSRLIFVLTPEFIKRDFSLLEQIKPGSNALAIRLKSCEMPQGLNFNSYIDLSFMDMTDKTLQHEILPKLISTLQLPKPICS